VLFQAQQTSKAKQKLQSKMPGTNVEVTKLLDGMLRVNPYFRYSARRVHKSNYFDKFRITKDPRVKAAWQIIL